MKVCLLTPGQPSTNPRLVKEADALAEAGFDVHVVYAHWADWAAETDRELLASRAWTWSSVGGSPQGQAARYRWTRLRHGLSRCAAPKLSGSRLLARRALSRVAPELQAAARSIPADLYIGHNLAALPAAVAGAAQHGALAGFDAEDCHSGMDPVGECTYETDLAQTVERECLTRCAYVSAASPGIAEAYARKYGVRLPETILNVFPLSERPNAFRPSEPGSPLKLFWFSQTVGRGRGLEDAIRAMGTLPNIEVELHVVGEWASGYRSELLPLAESVGVRPAQIRGHSTARPQDLVGIAARHDIGLALEQAACVNRDICITNKIFTYLLAGNAVAATNTQGQQEIVRRIGRAGFSYEPGNAAQLAAGLRVWSENRKALESARREAWDWGTRQYNWDFEKQKFLAIVERVLTRPVRNEVTA